MAILWYNICSIMIGSLWDLKLDLFNTPVRTGAYHDRFPMGFETSLLVLYFRTSLTIMIGSLWDLKPNIWKLDYKIF